MIKPKKSRQRFNTQAVNQTRPNFLSLSNSRNQSICFTPFKNSIKEFHEELNSQYFNERKRQAKIFRSNQKKISSLQEKNSIKLGDVKDELSLVKEKVKFYRRKMILNDTINYVQAEKMKQKIQNMEKSINFSLPSIAQGNVQGINPFMYPPHVSNPYLYPPPVPYYQGKRRSRDSESESDEERAPRKKLRNKKKMSKAERAKNRKRLGRILRKVFRCVVYIYYLKNIAKKIMQKRRDIFKKFWPSNFLKSTNGMRKWFSFSCNQFFNKMHKNAENQLQIDGDQSDSVINQKKKVIKSLINILINNLEDLTQNPIFQQVVQIVHIFCKHGAFVDNGVLTPEELETVSVSDVHGYLRMDTNMEKSQLVNFILIKLITFNMLLQPWKYDEKKFNIEENKQSFENFYYISSVFYQMVLFLRSQYLQSQHNEHIEPGNWRKLKGQFKIKCSPSLCHLENNHQKGEFISGLVSENMVNAIFPIDYWSQQINTLKAILDRMYFKLRKSHWKLINEIYPYKDISRFQT